MKSLITKLNPTSPVVVQKRKELPLSTILRRSPTPAIPNTMKSNNMINSIKKYYSIEQILSESLLITKLSIAGKLMNNRKSISGYKPTLINKVKLHKPISKLINSKTTWSTKK